jgi:hypothetical protein
MRGPCRKSPPPPASSISTATPTTVMIGQLTSSSTAAFGRQLAVMSAQGILTLAVDRPVDVLLQLMIECGGPEAEAVRSYFGLQGPEQATATAVVLVTSSALVDRQVSVIFFLVPLPRNFKYKEALYLVPVAALNF